MMTIERLEHACIQLVDAGFGWTTPSVSAAEMMSIISQYRCIDGQRNDLLAVQQDADRLVRELDVLLNGEAGAAEQASLCDLVAQVSKGGVVAKMRFDGLLEAMHGIAGTLDELSQEDAVSSLKGGAAGIASGIRKSIIKIMGAAPAAKDNV